jgi:Domain of unknown function (DUF5666)
MTDTPLTELLVQQNPPGAGMETAQGDADADDDFDDGFDEAAPGRRLPRATVVLLAALLVAAGFAGGILVQKHAAPTTAAAGVPSFGGGFPTGGFPAGGAGQGADTGAAAATGSSSSSATNSPVVIGTVVSVDGTTVIVKDLGGTQHRVTTTPSTTVSETRTLPTNGLKAGQSVVVNGSKRSDGTITATSVTAR